MSRPTKKTSEPYPGDDDLDDIQTLKNLLELHTSLKVQAGSISQKLD